MNTPLDSINICGLKAVQAVFRHHPEHVERIYFTAALEEQSAPFCQILTRLRKFSKKVTDDEMQRITKTVHHGGIVAVTNRPAPAAPTARELRTWKAERLPILLLDRIGNPHNLGAIIRSAAFFGIKRVVIARHPAQAMPSDAVYRIAEGGMESVSLYVVPKLADFCYQITNDFMVIGADVHTQNAASFRTAPSNDHRAPALVLGNEETGLDSAVQQACEKLVCIPGSGAVESLNVSSAAAVLMAWLVQSR